MSPALWSSQQQRVGLPGRRHCQPKVQASQQCIIHRMLHEPIVAGRGVIVESALCRASNTNQAPHIRHQQHDQQPEQLPVRQGSIRPASHLQDQQCQWWSRAAAAVSAAVIAASAVLCPMSVPAASAHDTMEHQQHMADKMSSKFHCTPLTPEQRVHYFDLNGFTHKIHTSSPTAQALFDQGLLVAYNFNHPEALKSFKEGLKHDPQAPMMYFGIAYALSPYANVVWGPGDAANSYPIVMPHDVEMAKQAAEDGLSAAKTAASLHPDDRQVQAELGYLTALHDLWKDIRDNTDPAWTPALEKYATALEAIAADYPSDADAPALAGEARMSLNPWVYWQGPLDKRVPVEPERVVRPAFANITAAQARSPNHPLAAHLLIHLAEAGTPGSSKHLPRQPGYAALGEIGADVLSGGGDPAFPAMGHLTHMPSHIYLRVGRWHDAVVSNKQALETDEKDAAHCVEPYMPTHNADLLQFSAMMSGELKEAEALAHKMATYPALFGPTNMSDGRERSTLAMVQSRYALWDPLLALDPSDLDYSNDGIMTPPGTQQFGSTVYHYVRALAHAAKATQATDGATKSSHSDQMQSELQALQSAVSALPDDPHTRPGDGIGIYSPGFRRLGQIQLLTAGARAAVLSSDWSSAADQLQQAIQVDSSFGYTEPPRVQHPIKPCLAWVLMQQGKLQEAEVIYREDLFDFPQNPWSLKGLQQIYQQQNTPQAKQKLQQVDSDLTESWKHADKDLTLNSSCPMFSD